MLRVHKNGWLALLEAMGQSYNHFAFETNMPYIGQQETSCVKKISYCYQGRPKIESIKIVSYVN